MPTAPGVHELFVKEACNAARFGGTYADYTLVQPVLVVVDRRGAIIQLWSWNTAPLRDVVIPDGLANRALTPVGPSGGLIVRVRPDPDDLGPSIKEGRSVKLLGLE